MFDRVGIPVRARTAAWRGIATPTARHFGSPQGSPSVRRRPSFPPLPGARTLPRGPRTRAFHHFSVGGDLAIEEEEVLDARVEEVSCRWCGASGTSIEEMPVGEIAVDAAE